MAALLAATRTSIGPSTLRSYAKHVERHLIPHLGRIRLGELTGRHVAEMIAKLAATDNRYGRPPTP
jgi:Phage integrase, N-terminal SAM-like domain